MSHITNQPSKSEDPLREVVKAPITHEPHIFSFKWIQSSRTCRLRVEIFIHALTGRLGTCFGINETNVSTY